MLLFGIREFPCSVIWVFPKIGVPQNGWMIWGYHYFQSKVAIFIRGLKHHRDDWPFLMISSTCFFVMFKVDKEQITAVQFSI